MDGEIILGTDGKTVFVKDVQIQDENLYQFLQEVEEERRRETLVAAIRIGVIGLRRMAVGEELDYVEKEFTHLLSEFDKKFDPDIRTSHLGKLVELMGEYFNKGGTIECMFDPIAEGTPLYKLRHEILEEFKGLRDIVSTRKGAESIVERTTLKGFAFEDDCEEILNEFVSHHIGDELKRVSAEVGEIRGSKVGDFVITLRGAPDKKIVIEAKDKDISQPGIIEELEGAMENRSARYGIFVTKYKEALPKKIGWFNEFKGNMLVCALGSKEIDTFFPEILNIAYQWAKLRLEKEITIEEKALETIAEGIKGIEMKLDDFSQIQKQCTNVETATTEIRNLSKRLREEISGQIMKIQSTMTAM